MSLTQDHQERLEAQGQGHILRRLDGLDERGRERLLAQLERVDLDVLAAQRAQLDAPAAGEGDVELAPAEVFPLRRDAGYEARAAEARRIGEASLAEGKVGFLVVAGGQASRLGYDGPKGAFGLGPVSGCSLFEYHAHRLMALERRHGREVYWYVMTSPANDGDTRAFFGEQSFFGWDPERVHFFQQSMHPALDSEGRILMQAPDSLFLAPGGHGGTFAALAESGALEHARERGVEVFSYFQVDNPLVLPGDPLFIGLHAEAGASMSSKVVAKRDANEKVGIIGRVNGKLGCIEYSDLPASLRDATDASGGLVYGAGNIAVHLIQRAFVEELTSAGLELPWHLARKQMSVIDEHGQRVDVEGVKFERFVFDALGHSQASVTLEVDRAVEFSPVKNKSGQDSPSSARQDLQTLHAGWCRHAGLPLPEADENGVCAVEIDPLLAEDPESLKAAAPLEPIVSERGFLYR